MPPKRGGGTARSSKCKKAKRQAKNMTCREEEDSKPPPQNEAEEPTAIDSDGERVAIPSKTFLAPRFDSVVIAEEEALAVDQTYQHKEIHVQEGTSIPLCNDERRDKEAAPPSLTVNHPVVQWLTGLGLQGYSTPIVEEHGFSRLEWCCWIGEEEITLLGLTTLAHRKALAAGVEQLKRTLPFQQVGRGSNPFAGFALSSSPLQQALPGKKTRGRTKNSSVAVTIVDPIGSPGRGVGAGAEATAVGITRPPALSTPPEVVQRLREGVERSHCSLGVPSGQGAVADGNNQQTRLPFQTFIEPRDESTAVAGRVPISERTLVESFAKAMDEAKQSFVAVVEDAADQFQQYTEELQERFRASRAELVRQRLLLSSGETGDQVVEEGPSLLLPPSAQVNITFSNNGDVTQQQQGEGTGAAPPSRTEAEGEGEGRMRKREREDDLKGEEQEEEEGEPKHPRNAPTQQLIEAIEGALQEPVVVMAGTAPAEGEDVLLFTASTNGRDEEHAQPDIAPTPTQQSQTVFSPPSRLTVELIEAERSHDRTVSDRKRPRDDAADGAVDEGAKCLSFSNNQDTGKASANHRSPSEERVITTQRSDPNVWTISDDDDDASLDKGDNSEQHSGEDETGAVDSAGFGEEEKEDSAPADERTSSSSSSDSSIEYLGQSQAHFDHPGGSQPSQPFMRESQELDNHRQSNDRVEAYQQPNTGANDNLSGDISWLNFGSSPLLPFSQATENLLEASQQDQLSQPVPQAPSPILTRAEEKAKEKPRQIASPAVSWFDQSQTEEQRLEALGEETSTVGGAGGLMPGYDSSRMAEVDYSFEEVERWPLSTLEERCRRYGLRVPVPRAGCDIGQEGPSVLSGGTISTGEGENDSADEEWFLQMITCEDDDVQDVAFRRQDIHQARREARREQKRAELVQQHQQVQQQRQAEDALRTGEAKGFEEMKTKYLRQALRTLLSRAIFQREVLPRHEAVLAQREFNSRSRSRTIPRHQLTQAEKEQRSAEVKAEQKKGVQQAVVAALVEDARTTVEGFVAYPPPSCTTTVYEQLAIREGVMLEKVTEVVQGSFPKVTSSAVGAVLSGEGLPVESEAKKQKTNSWYTNKFRGRGRGAGGRGGWRTGR